LSRRAYHALSSSAISFRDTGKDRLPPGRKAYADYPVSTTWWYRPCRLGMLLPSPGHDSVNLSPATVAPAAKGYIVGQLHSGIFYERESRTRMSATDVVRASMACSRWVYLHYFKQVNPR